MCQTTTSLSPSSLFPYCNNFSISVLFCLCVIFPFLLFPLLQCLLILFTVFLNGLSVEGEGEGEERKSIYDWVQCTLHALIIYSDLQPQANHSCRDKRGKREREAATLVLTVPWYSAKLFEAIHWPNSLKTMTVRCQQQRTITNKLGESKNLKLNLMIQSRAL